MRTRVIIVLAVICAFAGSEKLSAQRLRNQSDSVSYAMGLDIGLHLKGFPDVEVNIGVVYSAIKNVYSGREKMEIDEAHSYLRHYFSEVVPERNRRKEQLLLDSLKSNGSLTESDSGLLYEIIDPGSEVRPVDDRDQITVHYQAMTPDGNIFDSSYERGEPTTFQLNRVIRGWTEGMKLIGEGGRINLWIPSALGYGPMGNHAGGINGYTPLYFEVELIEVLFYEEDDASGPAYSADDQTVDGISTRTCKNKDQKAYHIQYG